MKLMTPGERAALKQAAMDFAQFVTAIGAAIRNNVDIASNDGKREIGSAVDRMVDGVEAMRAAEEEASNARRV